MRNLIILILIVLPLFGQSQTLTENYLQVKAEYTALASQSDFEFEPNLNISRYKNFYTNWITVINGSKEANKFLEDVINDDSGFILGKVKEAAQTERVNLIAQYESLKILFDKAIEDDTAIPTNYQKTVAKLENLFNSLAPIKALSDFEVQSTWEGLIIIDGFSVFNYLLVDMLNENLTLLLTKYQQAVQAEFLSKKAELKKEAEDLLKEIG